MIKLSPGDTYTIEWENWDHQLYRVEEIRGDTIVSRRWIGHREKWTAWPVLQSIQRLPWHKTKKVNT